jgi:N-acetylneuraminic acid mutarotase
MRPTASLLANGTILFVGDDLYAYSTAPTSVLAAHSTEVFDPLTGTFSEAAEMNTTHTVGQAQLTFSNGKVFVCGGQSAALIVGGNGVPEAGYSPITDTETFDPAANVWTTVANMNAARSGHTATLLQSGKVLAVGGEDSGGNAINSVEIYDPVADTWTSAASLNAARFGHTAILLNDGTVLVMGGGTNTNEIYDPATNTWKAVANLLTSRYGYTVTLLSNGKVLITGGVGNSTGKTINSTEIYDPATNLWSNGASMNATRFDHSATLLPDGKVLVAGGQSGQYYYPTLTAEIYDPAANSWTNVASMHVERFKHIAVLLPNGKLLVAYGPANGSFSPGATGSADSQGSAETYDPAANTWTASGMTMQLPGFSTTKLANGQMLLVGGPSPSTAGASTFTQIFNPATNTWSVAAPLNTAREYHTATLLQNGKVLVVGGDSTIDYTLYFPPMYPPVLASVELYDPATNAWTTEASLITGRTAHTATLLPNGKVLVAGGVDSNGVLVTTAEIYDPNANTWAAAGTLITPRYQHTATLLNTGKVLLAGGNSNPISSLTATPLNAAELYDPAANSWTATPNMPLSVAAPSSILLSNGTVVLAGGVGVVPGIGTIGPIPGVLSYTPSTNSWSQLAAMNYQRSQNAATLLSNGQILVTGIGLNGYGSVRSEIYTPSSNTWTNGAPLNLPRGLHTSTLLDDGRVMIVGGSPAYIPEFWKP